jgi:hypothetical protein
LVDTRIEVGEIFREYGHLLGKISRDQRKVVNALINCRTSALGGHISKCNRCSHTDQSYNSCRNRHCPKCQFSKQIKWVDQRAKELLAVDYFHVVFTLPHELNPLILQNKKVCYDILFKSVSETLKEVAKNPKNLGANIGFFSILHTWGQKLTEHPHIHVVVPSGGLSPDKRKWISCRENYFLPIKILNLAFRAKFLEYLKGAFDIDKLAFRGRIIQLENRSNFGSLISTVRAKEWIVYAKKPFSGPSQVLNYLGKYTHRIAISNYRILKLEDGVVSFSYKDYGDDSKKKIMKLDVKEFMRRFLLHVLPRGYVRIRHYGILGNKYKKENIERCNFLLRAKPKKLGTVKVTETIEDLIKRTTGVDITICKICNSGTMENFQNISAFYDSS